MFFPYNDIFYLQFFNLHIFSPKILPGPPPPQQKSDLIYNIFFLHIKRFSGGGPPPLFSQSLNFVNFFLRPPLCQESGNAVFLPMPTGVAAWVNRLTFSPSSSPPSPSHFQLCVSLRYSKLQISNWFDFPDTSSDSYIFLRLLLLFPGAFLYCIILYCYCIVLYCYCIVLYCYCIVLYSTILYKKSHPPIFHTSNICFNEQVAIQFV